MFIPQRLSRFHSLVEVGFESVEELEEDEPESFQLLLNEPFPELEEGSSWGKRAKGATMQPNTPAPKRAPARKTKKGRVPRLRNKGEA
jgi:hypothetical protein